MTLSEHAVPARRDIRCLAATGMSSLVFAQHAFAVPTPTLSTTRFRLGDCWIDPLSNTISRGAEERQVEPRVLGVLCAIAECQGEVALREAILEQVWGPGAGTDEGLSRAVSILRKTFKSLGVEQDYIVTAPKKGYRLVVAPDTGVTPAEAGTTSTGPGRGATRTRWVGLVAAAALSAALLAAIYTLTGRKDGPDAIGTRSGQIPIAVLPFRPLSDREADAWFGDGVTEELINALAAIDDLAVAARTSSFSFKNVDRDIREIARQLDVDYVVEGSVRSADGKTRVAAQLIRAADGYHVWSGVLEEATGASFELQDEIVREISRALQLRLHVGYGDRVAPRGNYAPEAVERYYQGLHVWGNRMRRDGAIHEAYELLRAAVEIDPGFAEAWSALAIIGVSSSSGPLSRNKEDFINQVSRDVERALQLQPEDYLVNAALVFWYTSVEIDLDRAKLHLEQAQAIAPKAGWVLVAAARYSWIVGDLQTALENYRRTIRLDPLNNVARMGLAVMLSIAGETSSAFEFFDACQQSNCLQEGFVAYASAAAILSEDPSIKQRWSPIYDQFEAVLETIPESSKPTVVKVNPAYYSIGFEQADTNETVEGVRRLFAQQIITNHIGIWGPALARVLPRETVIDAITLAYERGDLFSSAFSLSPFYGRNPYPDWVLEHPRYHALWERPELAKLAEMRRRNGWSDGLPKSGTNLE